RLPLLSRWLKRGLGLAEQRALPRFDGDFLATASASPATSTREVLLFVDTFNNYMEPENARAACRVLEAAGYRVHFNRAPQERPLCCGRTYLAAGQVDKAKAEARRTLDHLLPFVERGVSIVGLEPSCLLTMRDEFLRYGYGEEARALAKASLLFEEFLVRERDAGRMLLALKPLETPRVLLHGHCHQKAFDALRPVEQVLRWIPDLEVRTIETSCCGMAGSFGYEREHYETSMQMAELALLPAVRQAKAGDLVVADGTSCRHQIHDGAQRMASHVARVLERALV
uniref:(Fe-S)-binding protein n=2 Tax=Stutzerimonas nitrititolerans TaxID=2482751 RepID=UPI00289DBF2D